MENEGYPRKRLRKIAIAEALRFDLLVLINLPWLETRRERGMGQISTAMAIAMAAAMATAMATAVATAMAAGQGAWPWARSPRVSSWGTAESPKPTTRRGPTPPEDPRPQGTQMKTRDQK